MTKVSSIYDTQLFKFLPYPMTSTLKYLSNWHHKKTDVHC